MKVYIVYRFTRKVGLQIHGVHASKKGAIEWIRNQGMTLYGSFLLTSRKVKP